MVGLFLTLYIGLFAQPSAARQSPDGIWVGGFDTGNGYWAMPVTFFNGNVKLAGTIFKPANAGRHPGVVFIHGSGELEARNVKQMAAALKKAGNRDYMIRVFPSVGHDFQEATTGGRKDYLHRRGFAPEFLNTIKRWVLKHADLPQ